MSKALKNTSIFQGVIQFIGPDGHEYRYEKGHIYKLTGGNFLHIATRPIAKATPVKIYEALMELSDDPTG